MTPSTTPTTPTAPTKPMDLSQIPLEELEASRSVLKVFAFADSRQLLEIGPAREKMRAIDAEIERRRLEAWANRGTCLSCNDE